MLVKGSKNSVRHIDIINAARSRTGEAWLIKNDCVRTVLPKFTHLEVLRISYQWLTPLLLLNVVRDCVNFRQLWLEVGVDYDQGVEQYYWNSALERKPDLAIYVAISAADDEQMWSKLENHLPDTYIRCNAHIFHRNDHSVVGYSDTDVWWESECHSNENGDTETGSQNEHHSSHVGGDDNGSSGDDDME
jgi:hypothetical protein